MIRQGLTLVLMPLSAIGQGQRPTKIGLALSGGGAKGQTHIGILKAIESAGPRIDYITGTMRRTLTETVAFST